MIIFIKRLFFKILRRTPADMDMVRYWKTKNMVQAKVTKENGATVMKMEGEKYTFPGFPRGYLIERHELRDGTIRYGKLSVLKHNIKNLIFNDSWSLLEHGEDIADRVKKQALPEIFELLEDHKYDMVPPERMVTAPKEIHRAWTKVSPHTAQLRDLVTYILQEDDAYRFRFQWCVQWMPTWLFRFVDPVPLFKKSLDWLEIAETIGDMKERIRLFRRVILALLEDEEIRKEFTKLFREINWRKVKMSKADKYFFRGKYFKVDLDKFDY